MIEVIITDDHPLVREGIKKVFHNASGIKVIGEAADSKELMAVLKNKQPDILVLDINLPGKSGFELLKKLKIQYPNLPVLILSIHPEERMAVRVLRAGAWGYINKSSITNDLVNAVRKIVTSKKRYINPEVAEQLALQMDKHNDKPLYETLTDREFQVMCHIADGKTVDDIARKLSISPQTVYTYRDRVKEKLNLTNNVEITRYVLANDLIEKEGN